MREVRMKRSPAAWPLTRRQLLTMIGAAAGSGASYRAMAQLGIVSSSPRRPGLPTRAKPGASVLVLGGGNAGLVSALELRRAGYKVTVLEYNGRPGGRCWTLRGGDSFTELGGATQHCEFDPGFYLNPGPWRIPYHHENLIGYCRELGVALEPSIQFSHNTLLHSSKAFGGKPQRYGAVAASIDGHVAELLAKVTRQQQLDQAVTREDREILLEALRNWGQLDASYAYAGGPAADGYRPGAPIAPEELLRSRLWARLMPGDEFHNGMMQPVGGMDRVAYALFREVEDSVRFNARVTGIHQDNKRVTATYVDARTGADPQQLSADWCVCALPLTVLGQLKDLKVGAPMAAGIRAVSYWNAVKVGLQFKRRFWEQDDRIYGGISYTDLPIEQISYPSDRLGTSGKGVLLGAYVWDGVNSFEFTSLPPAERVKWAVKFGAQLHPQYEQEFENGIAVGWHRVPWILGCSANWSEQQRAQHFENLRAIDGRIVLAGDHLSNMVAWQEGALVSALDAIHRLHQKATA
jgi:monoamine oxidase